MAQFGAQLYSGYSASAQPAEDPHAVYTLLVDSETLTISQPHLFREPSNTLLRLFAEDPQVARHGLRIHGEPALWKLVQAHLRGYDIFPLRDGVVPYLSTVATLKSLWHICDEYKLENLKHKITFELRREDKRYLLLIRPGGQAWTADTKRGTEISKAKFEELLSKVALSNVQSVLAHVQVPGYRQITGWVEYANSTGLERDHLRTYGLFESE